MGIMESMGPKGTKETWDCRDRRAIRYIEIHTNNHDFYFLITQHSSFFYLFHFSQGDPGEPGLPGDKGEKGEKVEAVTIYLFPILAPYCSLFSFSFIVILSSLLPAGIQRSAWSHWESRPGWRKG